MLQTFVVTPDNYVSSIGTLQSLLSWFWSFGENLSYINNSFPTQLFFLPFPPGTLGRYPLLKIHPTLATSLHLASIYASFGLRLKRSSTTEVSAMVEISPTSRSPTQIFLSMRRMIFPERVLGRPGASWMKSGVAKGPILFRTIDRKDASQVQ